MRWLLLLLFVLLSTFVLAQPLDLCPACSFQGKCVDYGSQVNSPNGIMYCGEDSTLQSAKPDGASCSQSYECLSFMCAGNLCQTFNPETLVFSSHSSWFIPLMAFGVLFFLVIVFLIVKSSIKPKGVKKAGVKSKSAAKSQPNTLPSSIRLIPMTKKYSQFDKLERQIEETTKKLGRK